MKGSWVYVPLFSFFCNNSSLAAWNEHQGVGLGQLANILMAPTAGIARIMMAMAFVAGVGFLMGAIIQYKYHRENPQQVRLSTPLLLLALGLALLALPLVAQISSSNPAKYAHARVQWSP